MGEVLEAEGREGLNLGFFFGLDHQLQLSAPRLVLLNEVLLSTISCSFECSKKQRRGASGRRQRFTPSEHEAEQQGRRKRFLTTFRCTLSTLPGRHHTTAALNTIICTTIPFYVVRGGALRISIPGVGSTRQDNDD